LSFIRNEAFNANDFLSNKTPSLAASLGRESNGKLKRKPFDITTMVYRGWSIYFFKFGEGGDWGGRLRGPSSSSSEEQRRDTRYPTLT